MISFSLDIPSLLLGLFVLCWLFKRWSSPEIYSCNFSCGWFLLYPWLYPQININDSKSSLNFYPDLRHLYKTTYHKDPLGYLIPLQDHHVHTEFIIFSQPSIKLFFLLSSLSWLVTFPLVQKPEAWIIPDFTYIFSSLQWIPMKYC